MTRLHIHLSVENLEQSITFYSAIFGAPPTRTESDYAKWLLDEPRMNFAISARGRAKGLDHLGLQVESAAELAEVQQRLTNAALPVAAQPDALCCYVKSDKHWTVDPQGIPWEAFHTLDAIPLFGEDDVLRLSPVKQCCPSSNHGEAT